ncbi:hypothetical protein [Streptomyces sp. PU-14G]|uniref:DUF7919 family protein n=1 Tax=Streptomyces sp. PU-14G TaxID=2800808 RepID=UPI0034DDF8A6
MPTQRDLTEYTAANTVPEGCKAFNIGWLGPEIEFTKGETSDTFREGLQELCVNHSCNRMRGYQACRLGHTRENFEYPVTVRLDSKNFPLGNGEIRVASQGRRLLIAPNLVLHYVTEHNYLPPQEFIEAVVSFMGNDSDR